MIQTDQAVGRGSGRRAWTLRERGAVGLAGLVRPHQAPRGCVERRRAGRESVAWCSACSHPAQPAARPARSVRTQRMRVPRVRQQARATGPRRGPGLPGLCAQPCPRRVLGPVRRAVCACWWCGRAHPALRRVLGPGAPSSAWRGRRTGPFGSDGLSTEAIGGAVALSRVFGRAGQPGFDRVPGGMEVWPGGCAGDATLSARQHTGSTGALSWTCSDRSTPLDGARRLRALRVCAPRIAPEHCLGSSRHPVVDAARGYRDGQDGCGPLPRRARCRWSCAGAAVGTTHDGHERHRRVLSGLLNGIQWRGAATTPVLHGLGPGDTPGTGRVTTWPVRPRWRRCRPLTRLGQAVARVLGNVPRDSRAIRCAVLWRKLRRRLQRRRGGAAQTTRARATTWLRAPMPPLRRARRRRPGLGGQHWLGRLAVSRAGLSRGVVPDCAPQPHPRHIPPCP